MTTETKYVISLFDYTGSMVQPWLDQGYEAIIVDIQHPAGWTHEGRLHKLGFDMMRPHHELLSALAKQVGWAAVHMCFSFTPCTDMAVSGARWFKAKLEANPQMWDEALHFAKAVLPIAKAYGAPYMVENPVSKLSTLWRKPNHSFQPWQFTGLCPDDNYTKKTCLWTSDSFVMPQPVMLEGLGQPDDRIHKAPPSAERMNFRSATPRGFAQAVCKANTSRQLTLRLAA